MDPRNAKRSSKGKGRAIVRPQTQPNPNVYRPEMPIHPQPQPYHIYYNAPPFNPYQPRYDNAPPKRRDRDDMPLPVYNYDDEEFDPLEFVPETQTPMEDVEGEEEDEVVPETQPTSQRAEKKNWTSDEEEALAKAWVKISVDKDIGDRQPRIGFWKRITKHFTSLVPGSRRTHDQLCSKWKNMNAALMLFNGFHTQATRLHQSGCNDLQIFERALADYHQQTKKHFTHVKAWNIVKDFEKWVVQPLVGEESAGSNKKRKSSESSGWENPTPPTPNEELLPNLNENPTPTRKNKGKKKMGDEASSKLQTTSVLKEYADKKLNLMQLSVEQETEKQQKYMALMDSQRSYVLGEKIKSDIEFLEKPHEHMTETLKQVVIARKRDICKEHGWPCDF